MIDFNQQRRLSGLPHISSSTIPTFLNQVTFNMDPADMTREQLLQLWQDERKLRQEAEKSRRLSWREALSLWHNLYANPKICFRHTTIGASLFTKATGRRYPTVLCHWGEFRRLHQIAFKHVSNQLARPEAEAFESREFYQTTAKHIVENCPLKDEAAVVAYQQRTVEEAVIDAWGRVGNGKIGFKSSEDHPLHNINDRVRQMNTGSVQPITPTKRRYDRVCYITTSQGSRDLFVIGYKAADKLTPEVVMQGLRNMDGMEVAKIKERVTVSKEKGRRKEEMAEEAIVVVVTQTFDYMVEQGLSFGYVDGGNAFIFLFMYPGKTDTLYYEKVIPEAASTTSSDPDERLRLTSVGLVTAFAQMALDWKPWSTNMRSKARQELPIWDSDDAQTLANLTESPDRPSNDSSEFEESDDETFPDTSPAKTRAKAKARKDRTGCQKGDSAPSRLRKDDDSSGEEGRTHAEIAKSAVIQSASRPGARTEAKNKKDQSNNRGQKRAAADILQRCGDLQADTARLDRPYCTQACLLGLIRGHVLDQKCPNVQAHRKGARNYSQNTTNGRYKRLQQDNKWHTLDQPTLARLVDEQLQRPERDDDCGFVSLDRAGWAGALFRLELLSHGYTFVGKGTVQPLVPVLHIEADMYKRMDALQGKAIPVYLGNVDLTLPFHLTTSVTIVHLLLLSWAGEEAWRCGIESERLWLETVRTNHEVAALGVQQGDLRDQNVLWNLELDRAILIDFEYAHIDEADEVIEAAIAEQAKAKDKIKALGQISGNQAGTNHPSASKSSSRELGEHLPQVSHLSSIKQ